MLLSGNQIFAEQKIKNLKLKKNWGMKDCKWADCYWNFGIKELNNAKQILIWKLRIQDIEL